MTIAVAEPQKAREPTDMPALLLTLLLRCYLVAVLGL